jgi:hypothetical protein
MITCKTCNGLLVGDRKKGKYTYYACNKCRTYYSEAFFDQHTARTLERIAIDEDMTDFLLHQLGDWYDETTSTQTTGTERLRKRITELQRLKAASYEEKLLGRLTEEGGLQVRRRAGSHHHRAPRGHRRHDRPHVGGEGEVLRRDRRHDAHGLVAAEGERHLVGARRAERVTEAPRAPKARQGRPRLPLIAELRQ